MVSHSKPWTSHLRIGHCGKPQHATAFSLWTFFPGLSLDIMVLSGDLTFEEESTSLVHEVSLDTQIDSHTWSRVMMITGKLWDACNHAQEISVYVLHAVHTFHDETWDLFTFVGGSSDYYGDLNTLISSSRKKAGGDFTVIHCSGNWQPQIDPAMLHFRLQLVNRHGTRLRPARPFNQDDFFVRAHEQAALVFTAEKKTDVCSMCNYWRWFLEIGHPQILALYGCH